MQHTRAGQATEVTSCQGNLTGSESEIRLVKELTQALLPSYAFDSKKEKKTIVPGHFSSDTIINSNSLGVGSLTEQLW